MTTIYYTVPSDGDDLAHPNVYKIPNISPKELTLATVAQVRSPHETRDVRHVFIDVFFSHRVQTFPLPGNWHFRFKFDYRNTYVWLDVTNALSKVPMFKGSIFIKAARMKYKTKMGKKKVFKKPRNPRPTRPPAPSMADPTLNEDNEDEMKSRLRHRQSSEELLNLDSTNSGNLLDSSPELMPVTKPRSTSDEDLMSIWNDEGSSSTSNKSSTLSSMADDDEHDLASLFN